ncbi:MAG TPA: hypothetical protein VFE56_11415, partial [Candidatus Binataceae bacterium]|nr:hypothetical protein [Candidatus Binataceae bacterium]
YGWQNPQHAETWRLPPYFADIVAPVLDLGRGSPTGVACYRHGQFPETYQGGFFLLDWTFGRVYFLKLKRSGSTYTAEKQIFLEATGDNGFAPTAIAVHPDTGDLYISIGGRGTRGAVYRIRYPSRAKAIDTTAVARLRVSPRSLEWQPGLQKELLHQAGGADDSQRLRALLAIHRHRDHFPPDQVQQAIQANWRSSDRYVRQAVGTLLASLPLAQRQNLGKQAQTSLEQITYGLGSASSEPAGVLVRAAHLLAAKDAPAEDRLASVRLIQLALGDLLERKRKGTVWEGYSLRREPPASPELTSAVAALRAAFPSGHADLDREISRTLAALQDDDPGVLARVSERFRPTSEPVEDIHYLIALARLRAPRSAALTKQVAAALLGLDRKLTKRHANRDRNWPLRLGEVYAELARKVPGLHAAMLANPDFGRPEHALFARSPGFNRTQAAEHFLARAQKDAEFTWTPALVDLLGSLPDDRSVPVLHQLWGKAGLDEAILPLLARHPQPADREKFLEGLSSPQLATIRRCLDALQTLPHQKNDAQVLALIRCLRSLPDGREEKPLHDRLVQYLRQVTGQAKLGENKEAWTDWFTKTYPDLATRLGNADGVDVRGWNE